MKILTSLNQLKRLGIDKLNQILSIPKTKKIIILKTNKKHIFSGCKTLKLLKLIRNPIMGIKLFKKHGMGWGWKNLLSFFSLNDEFNFFLEF